ncbi:MAG: DsrE family protein [Clostridia bacterium]|nr:DsrE family protein [Clostridia bacterium]
MSDKLTVLLTSDNKETVVNMAFMYILNAKKNNWFNEIDLIIWGPSQKLVINDIDVKSILSDIMETGVRVFACKACSDRYGISGELQELNIDVKYMGKDLTSILKGDDRVLTI